MRIFHRLQERHGATGSSRVYRDRRGLKIVVLQAGSLRSLSVPALIVTLTSSVFLVALSTAFVDYTMMTCMSKRELYRDAKNDVRHINVMCTINPHHSVISRNVVEIQISFCLRVQDIVIVGDHIEIDPEASAGHPARPSSLNPPAARRSRGSLEVVPARRSRGGVHDTRTRLGGIN